MQKAGPERVPGVQLQDRRKRRRNTQKLRAFSKNWQTGARKSNTQQYILKQGWKVTQNNRNSNTVIKRSLPSFLHSVAWHCEAQADRKASTEQEHWSVGDLAHVETRKTRKQTKAKAKTRKMDRTKQMEGSEQDKEETPPKHNPTTKKMQKRSGWRKRKYCRGQQRDTESESESHG